MGKQEVIEQIRQVNRSAGAEFLVAFNQEALQEYLRRLALTGGNARGRASVWVRNSESPAVVMHAR